MKSDTASMRIKSYYAGSVERAIQAAREELGGDATLITSRRSAPDARHLGAYEVVFGIVAQPELAQRELSTDDLNSELTQLRDQLDGIKRVLKLRGAGAEGFANPELGRMYEQLLSGGMGDEWARQITEETASAWQSLTPGQRASSGGAFTELAGQSIERKLRFAPEFTATAHAVILVGPPGAGKTTTLAKIAIQECLAKRISIRFISVDLDGVAAHQRLRGFADIMGVGFTAASTAAQFSDAVNEFQNKNVLLIDTPGYGRKDWAGARDLIKVLAQVKQKEVHLVLPASMQLAGLQRYAREYEEFSPDYLLFTKTDETEWNGPMLSVAIAAGKPLSFLATGQSVPEDIQAANSAAVVAGLFKNERAEAISAA